MTNKEKNNKSVVLMAVDSEDKKMIRRIIVQGGVLENDSLSSYTTADFNEAVLKEQPMVIKVPKKQVDIIKKNYLDFLESRNKREKDNE